MQPRARIRYRGRLPASRARLCDLSAMPDGLPTGEERIFDIILDTIGGTPMVRLSRLAVIEGVTREFLRSSGSLTRSVR